MKIRALLVVFLSLDNVEHVEAKQLALLETLVLKSEQMLWSSLETLYRAFIKILDSPQTSS